MADRNPTVTMEKFLKELKLIQSGKAKVPRDVARKPKVSWACLMGLAFPQGLFDNALFISYIGDETCSSLYSSHSYYFNVLPLAQPFLLNQLLSQPPTSTNRQLRQLC